MVFSIDNSLHPHLKGTITSSPTNRNLHKIQGTWSYDHESTPKCFEYEQTQSSGELPISGIYTGSFSTDYMQNGKQKTEQVKEKRVDLVVTKRGEDHQVRGRGRNEYGMFELVGVARKLDDMQYNLDVYKVYEFTADYLQLKRENVQESASNATHHHKKHAKHNTNKHAAAAPTAISSDGRQMTRVDGKGLWRSWKRNFNSQLTAILDLVDNSLDASISGQNIGFLGHCHINHDTYKESTMSRKTTTGIIIINNCISELGPLQKSLEVYDSSKVDSGADHVGENGVGLKQACATLSDLSFVLVKNGTRGVCELGIIAEELQTTEGVYLPAFQFLINDDATPLAHQMSKLFQKHDDVAQIIAQYGDPFEERSGSLDIGIDRLCKHFDNICSGNIYKDSPYVFAVVVDKVRSDNVDAITLTRVNHLLDELTNKISRTYLHVPRSFDFRIKSRNINFTYWQRRLVEFSMFMVEVGSTIPWNDDREDLHKCTFRIFCGFDSQVMIDKTESKYGALFVYSRQSGRLITCYNDARTMLSLQAGGSDFCSGLRIILDDNEGYLPLNPTKQDIAFSEKAHGEVFRENLWKAVGGVAHLFYKHHLKKYGDKKTVLSKKIADFGEQMAKENKLDAELEYLDLTTFKTASKFKSINGKLRLDVEAEVAGGDTLYRLAPVPRGKPKPKRGKTKKKARIPPETINLANSESELDEASDREVTNGSSSKRKAISNAGTRARSTRRKTRNPKPQYESSESEFGDASSEEEPPQENAQGSSDEDLFSSNEEELANDGDNDVVSFLPRVNRPSKSSADRAALLSLDNDQASITRFLAEEESPSAAGLAPDVTTSSQAAGICSLFGEGPGDEDTSPADELAEKRELVKDLTIKLEERNKTIADLRKALAEKDKEILELREQFAHIIAYERKRGKTA